MRIPGLRTRRFPTALGIAVALLAPLSPHAATYSWVGGGSDNDIRNVSNWSGGVLPINGDTGVIGGGAAPITANLTSRFHDYPTNTIASTASLRITLHDPSAVPAETPPGAIHILPNGTLHFISNAFIDHLNIVLEGGTLAGGSNPQLYGTVSVIGESYINGNGRFSATFSDGDIANPGTLVITGGRPALYSASTYTGGTTIRSGGDVYSTIAGALGYGDLVVESGGKAEVRGSSGFQPGSSAKIIAESNTDLVFYNNNDTVIAADGVILGQTSHNTSKGGSISIEGEVIIRRNATTTTASDNWSAVFSDGGMSGAILVRLGSPTTPDTGGGSVLFTNTNTYSGGFTLQDVTVRATAAGALGAGDVTVHANDYALLRLQHDDAIHPDATLTMLEAGGSNGLLYLDNVDVTVKSLVLGSNNVAAGTYETNSFPAFFAPFFHPSSAGSITVTFSPLPVPEPGALALLALVGLTLTGRRTRHRA